MSATGRGDTGELNLCIHVVAWHKGNTVPPSKYSKPPGPFPKIDPKIAANFKFDADQEEILRRALPGQFHKLSCKSDGIFPPDTFPPVWTIADAMLAFTAEQIGFYKSMSSAMKNCKPLTLSQERAAIKRLLRALVPFVEGYVSEETADLLPVDLVDQLKKRHAVLESMPPRPTRQQPLLVLCGTLGVLLMNFATANDITLTRAQVLDFVSQALDFAGIKHPSLESHSGGLEKLVFPPKFDCP